MSLKLNIIANYIGQVWSSLIGIIFIPVYIKYLGIEAYGLIGIFAVLQTWLSILDMGMNSTISREMARFTGGSHSPESIRNLLRTVEVIASGMSILLLIVILIGADFIVKYWLNFENLSKSTVIRALNIMAIIIALRFIQNIYSSSLVGLQRQVLYNITNCILQTLRAIGAIGVLEFISPTIDAFFLWQAFISLITIIIFALLTYNVIPKSTSKPKFSTGILKDIWRYAGGISIITLLSVMLMQVDKLILSKILTLSEFGYYTLAVTVASGIYMVLNPIGQAFHPKLCQLYAIGNIEELANTYHKGAQCVTVIAGTFAIILIFFAQPVLFLWTQDYELSLRSYKLLQLIVLGNFLNGLCWMPYLTQLSYGWTSLTIKVNIVAISLIVPAILWVTPKYGAEGAAIVWIILNAGYLFISVHFSFRKILTISDKWKWYSKDIILPILPAIMIAMLGKMIYPANGNKMFQLSYIAVLTLLVFISISLSASLIRNFIYNTIMKFKGGSLV